MIIIRSGKENKEVFIRRKYARVLSTLLTLTKILLQQKVLCCLYACWCYLCLAVMWGGWDDLRDEARVMRDAILSGDYMSPHMYCIKWAQHVKPSEGVTTDEGRQVKGGREWEKMDKSVVWGEKEKCVRGSEWPGKAERLEAAGIGRLVRMEKIWRQSLWKNNYSRITINKHWPCMDLIIGWGYLVPSFYIALCDLL